MRKFILVVLVLLLCLGLYIRFTDTGDAPKSVVRDITQQTVDIKKNNIYVEPSNPTNLEAKTYNKLTEMLKNSSNDNNSYDKQQDYNYGSQNSNNDKKLAIQVAKSFVCDLFTLTNEKFDSVKSYVLKDNREDFEKYAKAIIIPNYRNIVEDYGSSDLPTVKTIDVKSVKTSSDNTYGDKYIVNLKLTYEKNNDDLNALKENVTITLVQMENHWYVLSVK